MAEKSVAEKARVRSGTMFSAVNPVEGVMERLGLPSTVRFVPPAEAQIVCVFIHNRAELESEMPKAIGALSEGAHLWVFFRKGSKAAGHDVNRDDVWNVAERHRLRPVGLLSVDDTWSVFRLRRQLTPRGKNA